MRSSSLTGNQQYRPIGSQLNGRSFAKAAMRGWQRKKPTQHALKANKGESEELGAKFAVSMLVRDYELDQYGVVNQAVYAGYFQHARHELLHYLGFDCDLVAREGRALALSKQSIQYLKPLRSRDSIKSVIQLKKIGMARVVMKQDVFKIKTEEDEVRQDLVASGEVEVVNLNEDYKPIRFSKDVVSCLSQFREGHDITVVG